MSKPAVQKHRCAIYTRKSSEEGLEQEFNSLHAQREACEAYVASQRSEGWVLVRDHYDDGGLSGGTLDRPALTRLLRDIEEGLVDVVVVYKIDRLSRSLMDFAKLVEVFDRNEVTFVSVTQSFNTTTSMGRLTLNILLSFAQFEREVTAERIRDKFRRQPHEGHVDGRQSALWLPGRGPQARHRRRRCEAYVAGSSHGSLRSARPRSWRASSRNTRIRTPRGNRITKNFLYRMLNNRAYLGEAVHKDTSYPGEHKALIDRGLGTRSMPSCRKAPVSARPTLAQETPALLKGLLYGPDGAAFSPTHTRKGDRLYRYYVSQTVLKHGAGACPIARVPAAEIETAVIDQIRSMLRAPEVVMATWRAAQPDCEGLPEDEVRKALAELDPLWTEFFPAEQARIIQLLIERVDIGTDGLKLRFRDKGLSQVMAEVGGVTDKNRKAAA